jgi:pimeloyl-ACP methyl ester carboxylesterase
MAFPGPQDVCILIPGFAGTSIQYKTLYWGWTELWLNYLNIHVDGFWPLQLADDGLSPGPDGGGYLTQYNELLSYYYGLLHDRLAHTFRVVDFPFDWRLDLLRSAGRLSDLIKSVQDPAHRVYIVAHSQGGLLARYTMQSLAGEQLGGLVTRLVCLGTPHYGTFSAVGLFNHGSPVYRQLLRLLQAESWSKWGMGGLVGAAAQVLGGQMGYWVGELDSVLATFPGLYQLLPMFSQRANWGGDGAWTAIWNASSYNSGNGYVKPKWLTNAEPLDDFLKSAIWPSQMVNVIGTGKPTIDSLRFPFDPCNPSDFTVNYQGDGTVPSWSANLPGVPSWQVEASHDELPYDNNVLAAITGLCINGLPGNQTAPPPTGTEYMQLLPV